MLYRSGRVNDATTMETSDKMRRVVDDRQRVWERWLLSQSSRAERTQTKPRRGRAVSPAHVFIPSSCFQFGRMSWTAAKMEAT
jgi:hypothetical protein